MNKLSYDGFFSMKLRIIVILTKDVETINLNCYNYSTIREVT